MSAARTVFGFGRSLAIFGLAVVLLGGIRLVRQFPAAAESPGLLVPFLAPVIALALEAGGLVAFSSVLLEALALAPRRPLLQRARLGLVGFVLLTVTLALAQSVPRGAERPGRLANELVDRARGGCEPRVARVPVPLLGFDVVCGPPQRIEGPMPGASNVRLSLGSVAFSDDLRQVDISGLQLDVQRSLKVHLEAGTARIHGLSPWARTDDLAPTTRMAALLLIALTLWLVATWSWGFAGSVGAPLENDAELGRKRQVLRGLLVALPGLAAVATLLLLDERRWGRVSFLFGAAAGTGTLLLARALAARASRLIPALWSSRPLKRAGPEAPSERG